MYPTKSVTRGDFKLMSAATSASSAKRESVRSNRQLADFGHRGGTLQYGMPTARSGDAASKTVTTGATPDMQIEPGCPRRSSTASIASLTRAQQSPTGMV